MCGVGVVEELVTLVVSWRVGHREGPKSKTHRPTSQTLYPTIITVLLDSYVLVPSLIRTFSVFL